MTDLDKKDTCYVCTAPCTDWNVVHNKANYYNNVCANCSTPIAGTGENGFQKTDLYWSTKLVAAKKKFQEDGYSKDSISLPKLDTTKKEELQIPCYICQFPTTNFGSAYPKENGQCINVCADCNAFDGGSKVEAGYSKSSTVLPRLDTISKEYWIERKKAQAPCCVCDKLCQDWSYLWPGEKDTVNNYCSNCSVTFLGQINAKANGMHKSDAAFNQRVTDAKAKYIATLGKISCHICSVPTQDYGKAYINVCGKCAVESGISAIEKETGILLDTQGKIAAAKKTFEEKKIAAAIKEEITTCSICEVPCRNHNRANNACVSCASIINKKAPMSGTDMSNGWGYTTGSRWDEIAKELLQEKKKAEAAKNKMTTCLACDIPCKDHESASNACPACSDIIETIIVKNSQRTYPEGTGFDLGSPWGLEAQRMHKEREDKAVVQKQKVPCCICDVPCTKHDKTHLDFKATDYQYACGPCSMLIGSGNEKEGQAYAGGLWPSKIKKVKEQHLVSKEKIEAEQKDKSLEQKKVPCELCGITCKKWQDDLNNVCSGCADLIGKKVNALTSMSYPEGYYYVETSLWGETVKSIKKERKVTWTQKCGACDNLCRSSSYNQVTCPPCSDILSKKFNEAHESHLGVDYSSYSDWDNAAKEMRKARPIMVKCEACDVLTEKNGYSPLMTCAPCSETISKIVDSAKRDCSHGVSYADPSKWHNEVKKIREQKEQKESEKLLPSKCGVCDTPCRKHINERIACTACAKQIAAELKQDHWDISNGVEYNLGSAWDNKAIVLRKKLEDANVPLKENQIACASCQIPCEDHGWEKAICHTCAINVAKDKELLHHNPDSYKDGVGFGIKSTWDVALNRYLEKNKVPCCVCETACNERKGWQAACKDCAPLVHKARETGDIPKSVYVDGDGLPNDTYWQAAIETVKKELLAKKDLKMKEVDAKKTKDQVPCCICDTTFDKPIRYGSNYQYACGPCSKVIGCGKDEGQAYSGWDTSIANVKKNFLAEKEARAIKEKTEVKIEKEIDTTSEKISCECCGEVQCKNWNFTYQVKHYTNICRTCSKAISGFDGENGFSGSHRKAEVEARRVKLLAEKAAAAIKLKEEFILVINRKDERCPCSVCDAETKNWNKTYSTGQYANTCTAAIFGGSLIESAIDYSFPNDHYAVQIREMHQKHLNKKEIAIAELKETLEKVSYNVWRVDRERWTNFTEGKNGGPLSLDEAKTLLARANKQASTTEKYEIRSLDGKPYLEEFFYVWKKDANRWTTLNGRAREKNPEKLSRKEAEKILELCFVEGARCSEPKENYEIRALPSIYNDEVFAKTTCCVCEKETRAWEGMDQNACSECAPKIYNKANHRIIPLPNGDGFFNTLPVWVKAIELAKKEHQDKLAKDKLAEEKLKEEEKKKPSYNVWRTDQNRWTTYDEGKSGSALSLEAAKSLLAKALNQADFSEKYEIRSLDGKPYVESVIEEKAIETQDFWVPGDMDKKDAYGNTIHNWNNCEKIQLPKQCPHCGNPIIVDGGSQKNASGITSPSCSHTRQYSDIHAMRIQVSSEKKEEKFYSIWLKTAGRWTVNTHNGIAQNEKKPFRLSLEDAEKWLKSIYHVDLEVREIDQTNESKCKSQEKFYNVWKKSENRWTLVGQNLSNIKNLTLEEARAWLNDKTVFLPHDKHDFEVRCHDGTIPPPEKEVFYNIRYIPSGKWTCAGGQDINKPKNLSLKEVKEWWGKSFADTSSVDLYDICTMDGKVVTKSEIDAIPTTIFYNVWNKTASRWSNINGQTNTDPQALTLADAKKLLQTGNLSKMHQFEIRSLDGKSLQEEMFYNIWYKSKNRWTTSWGQSTVTPNKYSLKDVCRLFRNENFSDDFEIRSLDGQPLPAPSKGYSLYNKINKAWSNVPYENHNKPHQWSLEEAQSWLNEKGSYAKDYEIRSIDDCQPLLPEETVYNVWYKNESRWVNYKHPTLGFQNSDAPFKFTLEEAQDIRKTFKDTGYQIKSLDGKVTIFYSIWYKLSDRWASYGLDANSKVKNLSFEEAKSLLETTKGTIFSSQLEVRPHNGTNVLPREEKFYSLWYKPEQRWTDRLHKKFNKHQDIGAPFKLSIDEAKIWLKECPYQRDYEIRAHFGAPYVEEKFYSIYCKATNDWSTHSFGSDIQDKTKPFNLSLLEAQNWLLNLSKSSTFIKDHYEVRCHDGSLPVIEEEFFNIWYKSSNRWTEEKHWVRNVIQNRNNPLKLSLKETKEWFDAQKFTDFEYEIRSLTGRIPSAEEITKAVNAPQKVEEKFYSIWYKNGGHWTEESNTLLKKCQKISEPFKLTLEAAREWMKKDFSSLTKSYEIRCHDGTLAPNEEEKFYSVWCKGNDTWSREKFSKLNKWQDELKPFHLSLKDAQEWLNELGAPATYEVREIATELPPVNDKIYSVWNKEVKCWTTACNADTKTPTRYSLEEAKQHLLSIAAHDRQNFEVHNVDTNLPYVDINLPSKEEKLYSIWNIGANRWTNEYYNGAVQDITKPFKLTLSQALEWLYKTFPVSMSEYQIREVDTKLPPSTEDKFYSIWYKDAANWSSDRNQDSKNPKQLTLAEAQKWLSKYNPGTAEHYEIRTLDKIKLPTISDPIKDQTKAIPMVEKTQDIWIDEYYTNGGIRTPNRVKISIPSNCPNCNHAITVQDPGDSKRMGWLAFNCAHSMSYENLLELSKNLKTKRKTLADQIIQLVKEHAYPFGGYVRDMIAQEDFKDIDIFLPKHDVRYTSNKYMTSNKLISLLQGAGLTATNIPVALNDAEIYSAKHHTKLTKSTWEIYSPVLGEKITIDIVQSNARSFEAEKDNPFIALDADVNGLYQNKLGVYEAAKGLKDITVINHIIDHKFEVPHDTVVSGARLNKLLSRGYKPVGLKETPNMNEIKIADGDQLTPESLAAVVTEMMKTLQSIPMEVKFDLIAPPSVPPVVETLVLNWSELEVGDRALISIDEGNGPQETTGTVVGIHPTHGVMFGLDGELVLDGFESTPIETYYSDPSDTALKKAVIKNCRKYGIDHNDAVFWNSIDTSLDPTAECKTTFLKKLPHKAQEYIMPEVDPYTLKVGDKVAAQITDVDGETVDVEAYVIDTEFEGDQVLLFLDDEYYSASDGSESWDVSDKKHIKTLEKLGIEYEGVENAWAVDENTVIVKKIVNRTDVQNKEKEDMNIDPETGEEMTFVDTFKQEMGEAGYRIASTQLVNAIKAGVLLMLKDKGTEEGKIAVIKEFLETQFGNAMISMALGHGLNYLPGDFGVDPRVIKIAEEFRVQGYATVGNEVIGVCMQYFVPALTTALGNLPPIGETAKTALGSKTETKARIATKKKTESLPEHEEVEEKHPAKSASR